MKRPSTLYLAVTVAIATLGSCQKPYHEDTERYVFVASNSKLPYWERAKEGFMDSAKLLKVKAEFTGPDRYDPDAELKAFQDATTAQPSGILVSPARPEIFKDAITAAVQAGIPVICVDSDSPAS